METLNYEVISIKMVRNIYIKPLCGFSVIIIILVQEITLSFGVFGKVWNYQSQKLDSNTAITMGIILPHK